MAAGKLHGPAGATMNGDALPELAKRGAAIYMNMNDREYSIPSKSHKSSDTAIKVTDTAWSTNRHWIYQYKKQDIDSVTKHFKKRGI